MRFCPWKGGRAGRRVHDMSCGISAPTTAAHMPRGVIQVARILAGVTCPTHPQAPLPSPQKSRPTIAGGSQHVELLGSALRGRLWRPQLAAVDQEQPVAGARQGALQRVISHGGWDHRVRDISTQQCLGGPPTTGLARQGSSERGMGPTVPGAVATQESLLSSSSSHTLFSPVSAPAPAWTAWTAKTLSCQSCRCASLRHACQTACRAMALLLAPSAAACWHCRCCGRQPLPYCACGHPSGHPFGPLRLLAEWPPLAALPLLPPPVVCLGRPADLARRLGCSRCLFQ